MYICINTYIIMFCRKPATPSSLVGPPLPTRCGTSSSDRSPVQRPTDRRTAACSTSQEPRGQSTATTTQAVNIWQTTNTQTVSGQPQHFIIKLRPELTVCRTEQGYCSIGYTACSTSDFLMSTTGTASVTGDSCSLDYVTISKGGASAGASTTADRFCGALLSSPTGTTTVYTNMQPFQVSRVL